MIALKIPIRIDSFYILTLLIPILFLLCGCGSSSGATVAKVPKPQTSCGWIYGEDTYNECLARAKSGDANAAFNIAEAHKEGALYGNISGTSIKKDRITAFYWYKVAADLGHEKALQKVFDGYYFGSYGPENKSEAERYLQHSARLGHQWAMLVLATRSEKQDPEKAIDLYLELARKDNCHAQRELARIYFEGKLVPQDVCKSYFWALLAGAGAYSKYSDYHFLARNSASSSGLCGSTVNEKYRAEKELGSKYVQLIQDAASKWQKGQAEPAFPKVQVVRKEEPSISEIKPPDSLDVSRATDKGKATKWIPAQIDFSKQLRSELKPSEIFNLVNPSVWTAIASSSAANLKAMNNVSLASAVAISEKKLLTNYHVIEEMAYLVVKQQGRFENAMVISGDRQTDRCIIDVENVTLKPVRGFRKYETLTIGETVYSVGSPKGLENTLGQGIISGKRELRGLKIIQTTAQISQGSSGGGLFDRFGNLIGITTFKIADSEGLNFAIAIDNFLQ